ncbi:MAG TPA: S-adenosylmethionine decarboxylase [Bryobacteraceae bacterium]|nr:S-adenosylmethionine decarboxylase [Bryobacteraceae bacterium]
MSGREWIVEAFGCDARALINQERLEELFHLIIQELDLHPLGKATWHQFPGTHGMTGVSLLRESHITVHTFPEYGSLCLNVFCCRPRRATDLEALLKIGFAPARVSVRQVDRPYET